MRVYIEEEEEGEKEFLQSQQIHAISRFSPQYRLYFELFLAAAVLLLLKKFQTIFPLPPSQFDTHNVSKQSINVRARLICFIKLQTY